MAGGSPKQAKENKKEIRGRRLYATCLIWGTSKNGASVALTARWASGERSSNPLPHIGHSSNSPRLPFLTNHSPQCQHLTTGVTHISNVSPPRVMDRLGQA